MSQPNKYNPQGQMNYVGGSNVAGQAGNFAVTGSGKVFPTNPSGKSTASKVLGSEGADYKVQQDVLGLSSGYRNLVSNNQQGVGAGQGMRVGAGVGQGVGAGQGMKVGGGSGVGQGVGPGQGMRVGGGAGVGQGVGVGQGMKVGGGSGVGQGVGSGQGKSPQNPR